MVNPTATENITVIKEVRILFDDVRSNLSNNEKKVNQKKTLQKKKPPVIFSKKERMMAL